LSRSKPKSPTEVLLQKYFEKCVTLRDSVTQNPPCKKTKLQINIYLLFFKYLFYLLCKYLFYSNTYYYSNTYFIQILILFKYLFLFIIQILILFKYFYYMLVTGHKNTEP
jgi:hypothetical protein